MGSSIKTLQTQLAINSALSLLSLFKEGGTLESSAQTSQKEVPTTRAAPGAGSVALGSFLSLCKGFLISSD